MPTTTTVPAFLAALEGALITALPGVQVSPAWPGPDMTENESVFIGDTIDGDMDIALMKAGRKPYDENYEVQIEAWVAKPGELRAASAVEVRTRAAEITDAIRIVLADEPDLGSGIKWARLTGRNLTNVPFNQGWACQGLVTVSVFARLT